MTTGIVNENAEEEKTKLQLEPVVEVLQKDVDEPPLFVKIKRVSYGVNTNWINEIQ